MTEPHPPPGRRSLAPPWRNGHSPALRVVRRPLVVLAVIALASLAARAALIGEPCRAPCRAVADHQLVFDEVYYVGAAHVIAGLPVPAGQRYGRAPAGDDPNAEHPQLAKVLVAGAIEWLGDGPWAWRLESLLLGTVALLGMFALTRAAGGGSWLGVGAAALMGLDNLELVHGRIGTLDAPVVAAMIWGAVAYLHRRPLLAGLLIGVGVCLKEVAPYVLLVLLLLELLRAVRDRSGALLPRALGRLAICAGGTAAAFLAGLELLDRLAPPYDDAAHRALPVGALHHLSHLLHYAVHQTSPHGPTGIASYPWQWLVDSGVITYLNVNPGEPGASFGGVHPAVHFQGVISPPILLLGLPGLGLAAWWVIRRRRPPAAGRTGTGEAANEVGLVGLAWFLGTFGPFMVLSLFWHRTSYLYYMVVVMPGLYLAVVALLERFRRWRKLTLVWAAGVLLAAVLMYPFTPVPW